MPAKRKSSASRRALLHKRAKAKTNQRAVAKKKHETYVGATYSSVDAGTGKRKGTTAQSKKGTVLRDTAKGTKKVSKAQAVARGGGRTWVKPYITPSGKKVAGHWRYSK